MKTTETYRQWINDGWQYYNTGGGCMAFFRSFDKGGQLYVGADAAEPTDISPGDTIFFDFNDENGCLQETGSFPNSEIAMECISRWWGSNDGN